MRSVTLFSVGLGVPDRNQAHRNMGFFIANNKDTKTRLRRAIL